MARKKQKTAAQCATALNYFISFLLIATQDKNEDNARKTIDTIIDLIMLFLKSSPVLLICKWYIIFPKLVNLVESTFLLGKATDNNKLTNEYKSVPIVEYTSPLIIVRLVDLVT